MEQVSWTGEQVLNDLSVSVNGSHAGVRHGNEKRPAVLSNRLSAVKAANSEEAFLVKLGVYNVTLEGVVSRNFKSVLVPAISGVAVVDSDFGCLYHWY